MTATTKKLYPPRRGLALGPWKMRVNEAYSERGGQCGREWFRCWVWFGRPMGLAGFVRLNGDGWEVRSRAFDWDGRRPVRCKWDNDNGVSMSAWPHPQGWKWVGVMRPKPSQAEYVATLEREMSRQRKAIDKHLRKTMIKAGWLRAPKRSVNA